MWNSIFATVILASRIGASSANAGEPVLRNPQSQTPDLTPTPRGIRTRCPADLASLAAPGRCQAVATKDLDRVVGSIEWEILDEQTGTVVASGDGPVHLKDVSFVFVPTNRGGGMTQKIIALSKDFSVEIIETYPAGASDIAGFTMEGQQTGSLDNKPMGVWFDITDGQHAVSRPLKDTSLAIEHHKLNGVSDITKTEFTTDLSLSIKNGSGPAAPAKWRILIRKGSTITWPSFVNGSVTPN
jgi:hypothetical protein